MRNNQKIGVWLIAAVFFTGSMPSLLEQAFAQSTINGAGATFHFL